MINQDLAKQILNVLLTTSEGKSFSGDQNDYQEAIDNPYNSNSKNWTITQSNSIIVIKEQSTTFPFDTSTDEDSPTVMDFKKDILPILKEGKDEEEQKKLDLYHGSIAKQAILAYIRNNLPDDEISSKTEQVKVSVTPPKQITTATPQGKVAPYYPIGITEESINAVVEALKEVNWSTRENNFPLWDGVASKLNKMFEAYKKKVLLNTTYYKTSSTMNVLEEKTDPYGNTTTDNKTITFPSIKYTYFYKEPKKYYFKITYPKELSGSGDSAQTWGTITETFNHTRGLWTSKEETLSAYTFNLTYCSQYASASGTSFYPDRAYIGLFTDLVQEGEQDKTENGMPRNNGTGFREPPRKTLSEEDPHTYQRMNLHRGLFTDTTVFNEVVQTPEGNEFYNDYKGYAYLNNQEIIMFPEILDENGWGTISGFGLFENEVPTEGETPFFWGTVTPVKGDRERVPLFRPKEFQIYLG